MTTPDEFRALIESPESTRVEWWAQRPLTAALQRIAESV